MVVHVKLHGEKEDRFEEIKEALAEELGFEPSNPEVLGFLMGRINCETSSQEEKTSVSLEL